MSNTFIILTFWRTAGSPFERVLNYYYYIYKNISSSENREYNYLFIRTEGKVKKRCERVKEDRKMQ